MKTDDLQDQFARIVVELRPDLVAHSRRFGLSTQEAEDAIQSALIQAWRLTDRNRQVPDRPIFYLIAMHRSLDILRQRQKRQAQEELHGGADYIPGQIGSSVEQQVRWKAIVEEIESSLEETDRRIFNLFYILEYTSNDVSHLLNLSHEVVRKRISRKIRPVVEKILGQYGYRLKPDDA